MSRDITWFDGTLIKPSTASAKTPRAEGIWSMRASEEVSKLTPEIIFVFFYKRIKVFFSNIVLTVATVFIIYGIFRTTH